LVMRISGLSIMIAGVNSVVLYASSTAGDP
jgi:hypothetical protein